MKKVLVIGGAKSGISVAKLLVKQGYVVILTDYNEVKDKDSLIALDIQVVDKGHPDWLLNTDYEFVVKNPGIKYTTPIVKYFVDHDVKIYTEIEIAYRYAKNFEYGAITGTNGKTTITTLLYEMLNKEYQAFSAGNIGTPLSQLALEHNEEAKIALELSNFQLLGIEDFHAKVSVVCNLAPDHLDYMPSVESYYASKMRIYENASSNDYFIRNIDDDIVMEYAKNIPCQVIDFSLKQKKDLYVENHLVYLHDEVLFDARDLKLVGDYNLANAMMASCMAYLLGVSKQAIQDVIRTFKGVEHRVEYVGEKNGVRFYNDSKATNTHAASAGLSGFAKNIILLAGGHDKGISFDDLKQYDERVKCCMAFGETKAKFMDIFTNCKTCETMKDALDEAIKIASEGDVILLSPACSSYDQFPNYEVRGKLFKQYVLDYLNQMED